MIEFLALAFYVCKCVLGDKISTLFCKIASLSQTNNSNTVTLGSRILLVKINKEIKHKRLTYSTLALTFNVIKGVLLLWFQYFYSLFK